MINKDPIYQQLNNELRELLSGDQFKVGDKFLTERTICDRYDVSRTTANKALSNLVSEGLLKFKKGVGTFIQEKPEIGKLHSITSFTENTKRAGMDPTSEVLRFERIKASDVDVIANEKLQIDNSEDLFRIERLRKANGSPMILEDRFIVAKYCPGLFEHSLKGSLYAIFEETYGLNITSTDETIQAVILDDYQADLLGVESGMAGFLVSAVGYIDDETPLWWETTLHKPDGFEFRCKVKPKQNQQKLEGRVLFDNPNHK
ncbi:MAG: GntR family transcriptional regulator [Spirochaetales bacterium]|uniref:GntR family transcriptional regulator n=1 Tax=Candidatus Thalassospirochaeta sargassi TaxID=3119039 RepID=A0AAJ1MLA4_9SPIO|nr:GntR family transcriptional regulator [Spirochaetales bacterium]